MFKNLKYFLLFLLILNLFNAVFANNVNNEAIFLNDLKINSLMRSVEKNDVRAVKIFLDNGYDINARNIANVGVLHIAIKNNALEVLKYLIENKADVNMMDDEKWTPLMRACSDSNYEAVKVLVDSDAKLWNRNIFNESALLIATRSDCDECIKYILKKDFQKNSNLKNVKFRSDEIDNAVKVAYKKQNSELEKILKDYKEKINYVEKENKQQNENIDYILNAKRIKEKKFKKEFKKKYKNF